MRISDWSSDVCSSDLSFLQRSGARDRHILHLHAWLVATRHRRQILQRPHLVDRHRADAGHFAIEVRPCRSEEHTSELQSLMRISYAVFCLKKQKKIYQRKHLTTRSQHKSYNTKTSNT